jgi:uncharacterized membrane protein YgdD (TMEM256/DUF423 family)
MKTNLLASAAIFGVTSVMLGAFGAHALKSIVTEDELKVYQTAIAYQFYHSLALLGCAILSLIRNNKWIYRSAYFFIAGIFLFCGSLYVLVIPGMPQVIGAITPLGGFCFIAGWISLLIASFQKEIRINI